MQIETEFVHTSSSRILSVYQYEYDRRTFPDLLVRIGIKNRLELRVGINHNVIDDKYYGADGSLRLSKERKFWHYLPLGIKVKLSEQEGLKPDVSILIQTTFLRYPTDSVRMLIDRCILYGWRISNVFSLSGSWGENNMYSQSRDKYGLPLSLAIRTKPSSYFSFYLEGLTVILRGSISGDSSPQYLVNSGLSLDLRNNLRINSFIGRHLDYSNNNYFAGFGLTFRPY